MFNENFMEVQKSIRFELKYIIHVQIPKQNHFTNSSFKPITFGIEASTQLGDHSFICVSAMSQKIPSIDISKKMFIF